MRRPHFALGPRLVVGVACVAAVLQLSLSGYRPHADTSLLQGSAATFNSVETRVPPPQSEPPDDWAAEPPRGVPVATCQLTPDEKQDLLLSFVYRIGKTLDEIERVSEKTLSIDTCYRAPFRFPQGKGGWFPTLVLGIIRVDHKESDVTDPANHYRICLARSDSRGCHSPVQWLEIAGSLSGRTVQQVQKPLRV